MNQPSLMVRSLLAGVLLVSSTLPARAQSPAARKAAEPEYVSAAGVKYFAQPDADGAVPEAEKKLAADPKNLDLLLALGRAQGNIWRFRDAISTYTRGLALAPNDARLLVARGHRYISTRRPNLALADLQKAARIDPKASGLWYHLGLAHYLRGEFAEAAAAFEKARNAATDDNGLVGPSDWLYMSLRRAGKTTEPAKVLERISPDMKVGPHEGFYLARLLLYKGVKKDFDLNFSEQPADMEAELKTATLGYGVGNWQFYNGKETVAREYFRRVVATKAWPAFGFICAEADLARKPAPR